MEDEARRWPGCGKRRRGRVPVSSPEAFTSWPRTLLGGLCKSLGFLPLHKLVGCVSLCQGLGNSGQWPPLSGDGRLPAHHWCILTKGEPRGSRARVGAQERPCPRLCSFMARPVCSFALQQTYGVGKSVSLCWYVPLQTF